MDGICDSNPPKKVITTPQTSQRGLDTNVAPNSFEPPPIPAAKGQYVVTDTRKPAYKKKEDFENDYYETVNEEYQAQKVDSGREQTVTERGEEFRDTVRKIIFNRIKFILKEADLDFGGPVFNCMMGQMKLEEDNGVDPEQYWNVHRPLVRETLNGKRGSVNGMMKDAFMSKWEQ